MQTVDLLPADEALYEQVVERWFAAALTEAAALQELDDHLYTAEEDPVRLDRARRLHAAWRQRAREAGALLRRALSDDSTARDRPGILKLRQEVGFAKALIQQSPELILQRVREARAGEVITLEEARRELRTHHRP